mgnify:FL=1
MKEKEITHNNIIVIDYIHSVLLNVGIKKRAYILVICKLSGVEVIGYITTYSTAKILIYFQPAKV